MRKLFLFSLLLILVLMLLTIGCGESSKDLVTDGLELDRKPKELEEYYLGDITRVDRVEILNSAGEQKSFTNENEIREWIEKIRHLQIISEPNQEEHSGFLYQVKLYEDNVQKLKFTPMSIGNQKNIPNPELTQFIKDFFESNEIG